MSPDQRADVSRTNGALSRGPVTDEGKFRSSRNSLKHGLCSDAPRNDDDLAALTERVEKLVAEYDPPTFEALDCLKVVAAVAMRRARALIAAVQADRATEAVTRRRVADALRSHVEEEARIVRGHAEGLRKDPGAALKALGATAAGCDWLADRFASLADRLDARGRLAPAQAAEAVRLTGAKPGPGLLDSPTAWVVRLLTLLVGGAAKPEAVARLFEPDRMPRRLRDEYNPDNLPDREEATRRLLSIFAAEGEKWAAEADRLRPEQEAEREAVRAAAALAADTQALRRARKYERMAELDLHRAWAEFHAAMARAAAPNEPSPAAPNEPEPGAAGAPNEPGTVAESGAVGLDSVKTYGDSGPSRSPRRGSPDRVAPVVGKASRSEPQKNGRLVGSGT